MVKTQTIDSKIRRIIKEYGPGFDLIYLDGKVDGINQGRLEIARNCLADGIDEEAISRNTGLSIDEIRKLKRKL